MRLVLVLLLATGGVGCAATNAPASTVEPDGLRYWISLAVHDTLAVFVRETRGIDPDGSVYFVWRVSGPDDRTITVERSPTGCSAVLVANAGRYLSVDGEHFPLVVGEDYYAVYEERLGMPHPALREGVGLRPQSLTGCWGGSEFPMAVRFSLRPGNGIIQTGRLGILPKRYINPEHDGI